MKIKSSYWILGQKYSLTLVKGLIEREGIEGYVEPHKYAIFVDASLKKNRPVFNRVLAHELCHAYAFESGLHEILSHQALEMFCQTMSNLFCKLNPR